MGMLATVMNSLAIQNAMEKIGIQTRVQSALPISAVCEQYIRRRANRHLEKGRIVIVAGGTGNPFFTTDSAAALRAKELNADIVIKGTKVNGVYDKDPISNPVAVKYDTLSHSFVLNKNLRVMDLTAISLAKDTKIPIFITNIFNKNSLINVLNRKGSYSKIS